MSIACVEWAARATSLLLILAGLFWAQSARADSWMPPRVQTIASPDGRTRLVITPRAIESSLNYFEDRVQGREPAGQRETGPRQPMGRLQVRVGDGHWRTVWERPLANDVSPVSALVSNGGGHVVTFDNWHSIGLGNNVVVIYRADGTLVRSLELDDIVPRYMIDAFARSVSSLYWQAEGTRIEGDRLRLSIVAPGATSPTSIHGFFVDVDLGTGAVAPVGGADLARWRPRACELHRRAVAELQQLVERERSDLVAPTSGDGEAWERYGHQIARRLYSPGPDGEQTASSLFPGEPLLMWLPESGEYMYDDTISLFRDALAAPASDSPRRLFIAANQAQLVAEIEQAGTRLRARQLAGVEMIFVIDGDRWPRIVAALNASGARLQQIDPSRPLPQHARNLAALPEPRAVDPACTN